MLPAATTDRDTMRYRRESGIDASDEPPHAGWHCPEAVGRLQMQVRWFGLQGSLKPVHEGIPEAGLAVGKSVMLCVCSPARLVLLGKLFIPVSKRMLQLKHQSAPDKLT